MGHSQQGFMVSKTHGTLFRLSVTTHGYSYHLTNFKPSAAAGWRFQSCYGWNLAGNGASFLFKRSISIALTLSPEPLVQLLLIQAIFLIGICPTTSIAVKKVEPPTRPVMSPGTIGTSQQRIKGSFTIQSDDETIWPGLLYLG